MLIGQRGKKINKNMYFLCFCCCAFHKRFSITLRLYCITFQLTKSLEKGALSVQIPSDNSDIEEGIGALTCCESEQELAES